MSTWNKLKKAWAKLTAGKRESQGTRLHSEPVLASTSHTSVQSADSDGRRAGTGLSRPQGLRGVSLDFARSPHEATSSYAVVSPAGSIGSGGGQQLSSISGPPEAGSNTAAGDTAATAAPSGERANGVSQASPTPTDSPAAIDMAGTGGQTGGGPGAGSNGASGGGAAGAARPEREPHTSTPRDEDLGSCPPYAAKAVWGLRYTMEDKWAAVPNLVQVPQTLTMPPSKRASLAQGCGCVSALTSSSKSPERARLMTLSNEDEVPIDQLHYFAVYDGHGGAAAAKHCAARMHLVLKEAIQKSLERHPGLVGINGLAETSSGSTDCDDSAALTRGNAPSSSTAPMQRLDPGTWLQAALAGSFKAVDAEFAAISEGTYVGTTAVVALMGRARMWLAHCGDSRAVLCRKGASIPLTNDHKASRDDEVARVQAAGGHVWWDRVMGELAVSRAIGDHCLRPYVISEPEVTMYERSPEDEVMVLASDGLWDVLSNQEAVDVALHTLQASELSGMTGVAAAKKAASALTKMALERGTRDNVTVLLVDLRMQPGGSPKRLPLR